MVIEELSNTAWPLTDDSDRGIILSAAIPFNLGVILQVAATEQKLFIVGRAFAGLGVGLVSVQSTSKTLELRVWQGTDGSLHCSSDVPSRDAPEMDSWLRHWKLPAMHHDWPSPRLLGELWNSEPE